MSDPAILSGMCKVGNIICVPFNFMSRVRRSIVNGTLYRVTLNVAIYNFITCTFSIYVIVGNASVCRHIWNAMLLPLWNSKSLPFYSIETLPIYAVCVVVPVLCALCLFAIHYLYVKKVQETELDVDYRGGVEDEESAMEKDGLAIEFIMTPSDGKRKFSIFVPVSKVHKQVDILEVISMENSDKKILSCLPYLSSYVIVMMAVCVRCYLNDGVQPHLIMLLAVSFMMMALKSYLICYTISNKINHRDNSIHGTGYINITPMHNMFYTFKEEKMAVVVKNKGGIYDEGALSMLVGDKNAKSIGIVLQCLSDILSKISKEKSILVGVTGQGTVEEMESVLRNLNNLLTDKNMLSRITGTEITEGIESLLRNLNDVLQGSKTLQTNSLFSLSGVNARFEHNPLNEKNNGCGHTGGGSQDGSINRPKVGEQTITESINMPEEVSVSTQEDGSENRAVNNGQPNEEEVKNIRNYLTEYLDYLKKGIKFKHENNGQEHELTLKDIPVKIVIHKTNGSEIVIGENTQGQNAITLDHITWIEGGVISAQEAGWMNKAWNNT